jgi:hypothetical protein
MTAASVLVQISTIGSSEVVEKLLRIEGEKQAHVTAGPTETFVFMAFIEGPDLDAR